MQMSVHLPSLGLKEKKIKQERCSSTYVEQHVDGRFLFLFLHGEYCIMRNQSLKLK